MSDIVWEEPPERERKGGYKGRWFDFVDELRQKPGEWARLDDIRATIAYDLKRGRVGGADRGEIEATMRNVDPKTARGTMYARYVGKPDLKAAAS